MAKKCNIKRILKRKQKGSKSWLKLQKKIPRLHQKVSDSRKDYHFKLSHHLASQVVRKRGLMAVGQPVKENAGVDGLTGAGRNTCLVKNRT